MNDKKLIKSLINLVSLTFAGKFLSLLSRLVMAREIGIEAMSYFSLVNPLMVLLINLAQFGLPIATSTLIAKYPNKTHKVFVTALFLSCGISLLLMSAIYFLAPLIARDLLNNKETTLAIYGLGLLIPLVALSSMLKAIYIGKGNVKATAYSTMSEESFRMVFLLTGMSLFMIKGPSYGALGAVVGMAIGEVGQSVFLYLYAPRKVKIQCFSWLTKKENDDMCVAKDLFKISLPLTMARLVGSLTYFLEPIIYTNMLKNQMSIETITTNYGILTGYVMPLLLTPGFFSIALANYLLPKMSSNIVKKQYKEAMNLFKKLIVFCLGLGALFSLVLFIGSDYIMLLLYNTKVGSSFVKILAFPFLIYYIESPIINAMHAINKTKNALKSTVISSIMRIVLLLALSRPCGIYAVAISTVVSALTDISLNLIDIVNFFKRHNVETTFKIKG